MTSLKADHARIQSILWSHRDRGGDGLTQTIVDERHNSKYDPRLVSGTELASQPHQCLAQLISAFAIGAHSPE